jgi:hypothetical protein
MSDQTDRLKSLIQTNAAEAARLHARIHETFAERDHSPKKREEWSRACDEFHARYDELASPGGFEGALKRIESGDRRAMEAAICFLELRPYFFRSGYMFESILRKAKRAPLSADQTERLQRVVEALAEWRSRKSAASAT